MLVNFYALGITATMEYGQDCVARTEEEINPSYPPNL